MALYVCNVYNQFIFENVWIDIRTPTCPEEANQKTSFNFDTYENSFNKK